MKRALLASTALMALAACTTNSMVETGPTWDPPTKEQVEGFEHFAPERVNPYTLKRRAPKIGKNGCATSVVKENDGIVIPSFHPDETYCIRLAPLLNTTLALPPGARLEKVSSAMGAFITIDSSSTAERDIILLSSKCVPPAQPTAAAEQPKVVPAEGEIECPRDTADLIVVMSTGVAQFRLYLNGNSRDARVTMNEAELKSEKVAIPAKPSYAQDLTATSVSGEMIAWMPDEAWATGDLTVIIWNRPMPTLPAFMIGPDGEQRATPQVVNRQGRIAMIWPQRVTAFQLRIDEEILAFSLQESRPFIVPAKD